jgi:hypothetical protein
VPRVSAFYGIVITMYFEEPRHLGRPHFHAEYAGAEASFDIDTFEPIAGRFPPRATRLVRSWARLHQEELHRNWQRARDEEPLLPIDPLP